MSRTPQSRGWAGPRGAQSLARGGGFPEWAPEPGHPLSPEASVFPGGVVLQMATVRGLRKEVTGWDLQCAEETWAHLVLFGVHPLQRGPRPGRCISLLILQSGAHGRGPHPLPKKGKPPHAAKFLDTQHPLSPGTRKRRHLRHDLIDVRRVACAGAHLPSQVPEQPPSPNTATAGARQPPALRTAALRPVTHTRVSRGQPCAPTVRVVRVLNFLTPAEDFICCFCLLKLSEALSPSSTHCHGPYRGYLSSQHLRPRHTRSPSPRCVRLTRRRVPRERGDARAAQQHFRASSALLFTFLAGAGHRPVPDLSDQPPAGRTHG